jgi:hypothetical protein
VAMLARIAATVSAVSVDKMDMTTCGDCYISSKIVSWIKKNCLLVCRACDASVEGGGDGRPGYCHDRMRRDGVRGVKADRPGAWLTKSRF